MKKTIAIIVLSALTAIASKAAITFILINYTHRTVIIHQDNGPVIRLTNSVDFAAITNAVNPAVADKVNP